MNTNQLLWLLPFIAFLGGYQLLSIWQPQRSLETPTIVGHTLTQAAHYLSAHNLNLRIMAEKIDPDLPDQTIISQKPYAGQQIKAPQTVFVVLSRQPPALLAPPLVGQPVALAQQIAQQQGFKITSYPVPSSAPTDQIIAQAPAPGQPLITQQLLLYVSANHHQKPLIMPKLCGQDLAEILALLKLYQLAVVLVDQFGNQLPQQILDDPQHYIAIAQKPLAGSLLFPNQITEIQLQIAAQIK